MPIGCHLMISSLAVFTPITSEQQLAKTGDLFHQAEMYLYNAIRISGIMQ